MSQEIYIIYLEEENSRLRESIRSSRREGEHYYKIMDFWRSAYLNDHPEFNGWVEAQRHLMEGKSLNLTTEP